MKELLIGLGALAVVALVEGLYHTLGFFAERRREELRRRLDTLGGAESAGLTLLRQGKLSSIGVVDELLRGVPLAERLGTLIEQTQLNLSVGQLLGYAGLAAVAGAGLGFTLAGLAGALALAAAGACAPILVLLAIRDKRGRKVSEQLPDALDMMARSLRAGHALAGSFKLVASEMPSPISVEFGRAFEEQNLGISFDRAILQMTQRVPNNPDLKIFAVSVIVQKETGGNLVEILEKIAETIRGRYRFYGKLRGLTAEGRVSGLVLGLLPIVTAAVLAAGNPEYMNRLIDNGMGRSILTYAVVSWGVGLLWLRQMAKVDF
jgi:tight adherence protein B